MALYDPTPRETVEAPSLDFTVADFLAWARTKPADEYYEFCNSSGCALAQFGEATGRQHLLGIRSPRDKWPALGEALCPVSIGAISYDTTFGALVKRLEAIL